MKPGKGDPATYADAGLQPGEVQQLMRGRIKSTAFYCHAPGGILVEVSASEG
ncbi:hypothetical protein NKJ40_02645 [Mesorhizobium sp. M0119]|uniref:hypothetical protein n=1 Tax=unclassified Mesorhizobium TaxID=325217 RepID=UPI00333C5B09